MKKILLSITFALMGIASGFAAKAYPGIVTVTQSDGTELNVRIYGDEHFNWLTTEDGVLLVQEGNNYYIAETTSYGTLKATSYIAHNANKRVPAEIKAIKKQDLSRFRSYAIKKASPAKAMGTGNSGVKYFPHSGSPKALVILVEFSDTPFQSGEKAKNVFEHFLKGKAEDALPDGYEAYTGSYAKANLRNNGSVSDYFYVMSQGTYTPQFDVVGPYKLNYSSLYYGQGDKDNTQALVSDACKEADKDVDFSEYDADGDGMVDLVYIIYAGYPASMSGNPNDIWPKSGTGDFGTYDGKKVSRFGIHAELNFGLELNQKNGFLLSGIGLFCHEFSHTLGLPDLYPTVDASKVDNQNPEMWDLMDGGEYTYNGGYCPTPYSPWEMDAMGWATPVELSDEKQTVTLKSYGKERIAYKIKGENDKYLLIQNIQKGGWWNGVANVYNTGMLVWRIDYNNEDVNLFDNPNNTLGKPKVMIVPADGYVISDYNHGDGKQWTDEEYKASLKGDPFPGTTNRTELLSVVLNNSTLEKPIYNIKEENEVITFDYLDNISAIQLPSVEETDMTTKQIFSLDGRYLGNDASKLTKGIYIIGKKKVVIK
ncbi:MAG: M6 family metalloprotease domain-containing protein [Prevotella copri]|nr:M6 family metalloprotease domain-containing protein [Segatella copri]